MGGRGYTGHPSGIWKEEKRHSLQVRSPTLNPGGEQNIQVSALSELSAWRGRRLSHEGEWLWEPGQRGEVPLWGEESRRPDGWGADRQAEAVGDSELREEETAQETLWRVPVKNRVPHCTEAGQGM